MKPLPLWSLSKTPKPDTYALSSPSRTTLLLVSKKSDGRISHDPREKEDSLSLKTKRKWLLDIFFLSSPSRFASFVLLFPFAFLFFLYLISLLIPFSFSPFFSFLSSFLFLFLISFCLSFLLILFLFALSLFLFFF